MDKILVFMANLPIDSLEKKKVVVQLEQDSLKKSTTQIFIETPYRNNQLIKVFATILPSANKNLYCSRHYRPYTVD